MNERQAGAFVALLTLVSFCFIAILLTLLAPKANAETIGSYKAGKYFHNVQDIAIWQKDIANDIGMPFKTQIFARVIQNQECGDVDGFCLTRIDCGPFQVNQIHKEEFAWCKKMVEEGIKERKLKNGRFSSIRNTLYKSQLVWLWGRMKQQVKTYEIPENREERIRQLGIYHNGGKFRKEYGLRCVKTYKILLSHYSN